MPVLNQKHSNEWALYNADCVMAMRDLPDNSVDFNIHSPPFLALYIYNKNLADLGNTSDEKEFFIGYGFALREMHRILKPDCRVFIHCKDTMRYMTSHSYAGLYDFPGKIIRACEEIGFNLENWVTVWKDPVVEMQRTKTYGLLHKSFATRAEVTRQGCADYVLVFRKGEVEEEQELPPLSDAVIERCVHQWTNENEVISTPLNKDIRGRIALKSRDNDIHLAIFNEKLGAYTPDFINGLSLRIPPGRLCVIHCTTQMMTPVIEQFEKDDKWKFHSRCALTDGTFLITFRNWSENFKAGVVKHNLKAPEIQEWHTFMRTGQKVKIIDGEVVEVGSTDSITEWKEPVITGQEYHPDYVGNNPPSNWRDSRYYSILVWQKYASPVWFDLDGLPESHPNILMDIDQTNVLNTPKRKRGKLKTKHICPLQLDLIEHFVKLYTQKGDIVFSPYGGIGSEGYVAVKLDRKAILTELNPDYWEAACHFLGQAEKEKMQRRLL